MVARIGLTFLGVILLILVLLVPMSCTSSVDAGEIIVHQTLGGKLEVWKVPGWRTHFFGTNTSYKKSDELPFKATITEAVGDKGQKTESTSTLSCFSTRFNDQGKAWICGQLSYELPMDDVTLVTLHEKYRGMEGVEERLIKPAAIKAIYNSGPLMSSKESAGKRRGDLIEYISDQATRGVYKTNQRKDETEDLTAPPVEIVEMTLVPELDAQGKPKLDDKGNPVMRKDPQRILKPRMKTVTVVEPARDEKGNVLVQEESATTKFGIKVFNITIEHIVYEEKVQEQINKQRDMEMAIQTKISEAEQAKQEAITAEQRGKAESASAKWAQEVVKAKAVTEAEMQRLVAEEDLKTAGLEKKAKIERAEGDAQAKKLIMDADGSLDKKLEAWKSVNAAYAEAFKSQPLVPEIVIGSSGAGNGAVNANDLIALMAAQTAKQIGLDLKFKK